MQVDISARKIAVDLSGCRVNLHDKGFFMQYIVSCIILASKEFKINSNDKGAQVMFIGIPTDYWNLITGD
jgi:hypothetical protein